MFHAYSLFPSITFASAARNFTLFMIMLAYCTGNAQTLVSDHIKVGEEVSFLTSKNTRLSASLLLPEGSGPHPAVVVAIGSGSDSYRRYWDPKKDSADFPFFREIARIFTDQGFAVLFIEKRGINRSEGNWRKNRLSGRAEDVFHAIRYLKSRPDISPDKIGICGHSQGGWVVQIAGAKYPSEVAFIVNLNGAVTTPKQQEIDNLIQKQRCLGKTKKELKRKANWKRVSLGVFGTLSRVIKINYFSYIINDYKPEKVLPFIRSPFLAVYGENDDLVPLASNKSILVSQFAKGNKENYDIVVINEGTHGLFRAPHCYKWKEISNHGLAPEFEPALRDWLLRRKHGD